MAESATPQRVGVYGRESKGKAKSVDDQVSLGIRAIDERPDWQLAGKYDDGSSASRFARKERADWLRLADDLRAGTLDILIVWEVARGSREPVDGFTWLNLCRDNDVRIYVISEDHLFDPRKTRDYDALGRALLDGAKESNTTSDRVLRGVREAAAREAGATPHGRTPYGYRRQLRNPDLIQRPDKMPWDEFYVQVPDPATAPIVTEIFERIARSDPIIALVNDLNSRGVPGPAGGPWVRQSIRKTVRNVAYDGKREHGGTTYRAVWEPIVDETLWLAANRVLDQPDRRRTKPGQIRWMLSYIVTSRCGSGMHGAKADKGRTAKYHCLADGCTGIGQWETDEFVVQLIEARMLRDDARELLVRGDSDAARAAEELAALERKLDEARESFARPDGISAASLAAAERRLEPMIRDAERRRASAGVPAALVDLVTAEHFRTAWDALPVAGQREVIQVLFREIKVGPIGPIRLGRWSTDDDRLNAVADRVTVEWR